MFLSCKLSIVLENNQPEMCGLWHLTAVQHGPTMDFDTGPTPAPKAMPARNKCPSWERPRSVHGWSERGAAKLMIAQQNIHFRYPKQRYCLFKSFGVGDSLAESLQGTPTPTMTITTTKPLLPLQPVPSLQPLQLQLWLGLSLHSHQLPPLQLLRSLRLRLWLPQSLQHTTTTNICYKLLYNWKIEQNTSSSCIICNHFSKLKHENAL